MRKRKKVIVISCGGTIEKTYDEGYGRLRNEESTIEQRLFNRLRLPHTKIEVHSLMNIDSLFMTDEHRKTLLERIKSEKCKSCPVVVIHGTDTMDQSARYICDYLSEKKAPIVFTGAMKPLELKDTDGFQNVVEALLAAKTMDPGVYISFHGEVFKAHEAKKDQDLKTFVHVKL